MPLTDLVRGGKQLYVRHQTHIADGPHLNVHLLSSLRQWGVHNVGWRRGGARIVCGSCFAHSANIEVGLRAWGLFVRRPEGVPFVRENYIVLRPPRRPLPRKFPHQLAVERSPLVSFPI